MTSEHGLLPVIRGESEGGSARDVLTINAPLVTAWLEEFLRHEIRFRRGFSRAVVGISGGVDSALLAYLCARALGPDNVIGIRMPYKTSSPQSLEHARLVTSALGIDEHTFDISDMVDSYL